MSTAQFFGTKRDKLYDVTQFSSRVAYSCDRMTVDRGRPNIRVAAAVRFRACQTILTKSRQPSGGFDHGK